ncbi:adenosylmethionine decarboxylase [Bacillus thuringiensis]|jgi:S-adenosylmethionine decarboxylase|uniref:S-adenosylmethionine decarboxylase proenzyme n=8 Tax=Bacillus cereus group TaxID=86661 RepID=A0A9Q1W2X8_BACTU|nr:MULTISPECIES: adenosylmethionine decarboxylase [Bacillus]EEM38962.1 S-adenosylmethionine decarboxylase 2 alpha chain [Bacillus thuringiensis serovar sotto str. T04001]MED1152692.1 adenosylmethionine decarboxylase [Bacillus paranthracis]ACK96526.1 adenosylmethionine decarboxylase 2 [Bacillus cereus G9842]AFQ17881.1 S-adenosylmethionine decarboxylase proenzyme [Bacillus thuringiensis HD-771]AFQ29051.1 S-adenosylmethionine decarboxylase proenzyme [Bacillus thuringiensis HD-789]
MEYSTFGKHIIVDLWGVDFSLLDDTHFLEYHLVTAADCSGAHVLNVSKKEFQPYGVTVLVLLSESHLSIHTYPEQNFAAIDCYTCGTTVEPQIAIDYIVNILKPERMHIKRLIRGIGEIVTAD